jgi:hypothetical protein
MPRTFSDTSFREETQEKLRSLGCDSGVGVVRPFLDGVKSGRCFQFSGNLREQHDSILAETRWLCSGYEFRGSTSGDDHGGPARVPQFGPSGSAR